MFITLATVSEIMDEIRTCADVFDEAGGAIRDATDESPGSLEDALEGETDKVFDAVTDDPCEPSWAADEVQAADDPAGSEQSPRDVVAGQALAERVVGGHQVLPLKRGKVEGRLEKVSI